jgi:hypothetical protein
MKKVGLAYFVALLVACNTDKLTTIQNGLSNFYALRLTPEAASIAVGQTQQLTVTAFDAGPCGGATCDVLTPGNPITVPGTPTFRSTDTTKVKVSAAGVATGIATGSASVIATLQDIPGSLGSASVTRADTTIFTVTAAATSFGSIALSASRATDGAASPDTLVVTYTDANGATNGTQKAATTTGIGATVGRPQFYSSDPSVATVGTTGIITGVRPGTATITAVITVNGVTKSSTFNVTITDPITATFSIILAVSQPTPSALNVVFFPGTLTVSATEAVAEGKTGAVVTWTVPAGTFTSTTTPNDTQCFNITFANPSAALATASGQPSGDIGKLCNGQSASRLFSTLGSYSFTNTTTSVTGTLIVK